MFLKLFTVVPVEHFVHGYDVRGVRTPGSLRLAHRRTHDVGHLGEQVESMVGGVLDGSRVELLQGRVPDVYGHFSGVGHRRLVQNVVRNEREYGCVKSSISIFYNSVKYKFRKIS